MAMISENHHLKRSFVLHLYYYLQPDLCSQPIVVTYNISLQQLGMQNKAHPYQLPQWYGSSG